MAWKKEFHNLYDKVKKKLQVPSDKALNARLQRKSRDLGLASSAAALVVVAAENNVGHGRELNKLDPSTKVAVSNIIRGSSESNSKTGKSGISGVGHRSLKKPNSLGGQYSDPYLPQFTYGPQHHEAYAIMFLLENSVRSFIQRILSNLYGSDWWSEVEKKKSLEKIIEEVDRRIKEESDNWYHSKRGPHAIYYTDYGDLIKIIRALKDLSISYFNKGHEKTILDQLEALSASRNIIAHNNPISKEDFDRLKVYARQWFRYMQHLSKQKN